MVIVLDEGPDPSVTKEIVCRNCGARLEYIPQGIKHNTYREIDGGLVFTAKMPIMPNKDMLVIRVVSLLATSYTPLTGTIIEYLCHRLLQR